MINVSGYVAQEKLAIAEVNQHVPKTTVASITVKKVFPACLYSEVELRKVLIFREKIDSPAM